MKRIASILFFLLTGCNSSPVADLMDYYYPGQLETQPVSGSGTTPVLGPPVTGNPAQTSQIPDDPRRNDPRR